MTNNTPTTYTVQVTNHPCAGQRVPFKAAEQSWTTVYHGPLASVAEAQRTVDALTDWYRHARVMQGERLVYANLRMGR